MVYPRTVLLLVSRKTRRGGPGVRWPPLPPVIPGCIYPTLGAGVIGKAVAPGVAVAAAGAVAAVFWAVPAM